MRFSRVVAVVASTWPAAAEAANEAAGGRGLFARGEDRRLGSDVQREVCDDVLYLALAIDPARTAADAPADEVAAAAGSSSSSSSSFANNCKHDLEALRRLLFVFSVAHVVVWVQAAPAALSLSTFGLLSTLKAARPRFANPQPAAPSGKPKSAGRKDRSEQARGWPGRSTPYLVFAFASGLESPRTQGVVMGTLKACGLVGNPTRSSTPFCRAVKNDCCCALSGLRPCVNRLAKQVHVDAFRPSDWLEAAAGLASSMRLEARSGLVSALEAAGDRNDPASGTTSSGSGGEAQVQLSKKDAQTLARLESATKTEEALCRALADKGMPFALETYVRGLPQRYGTKVHESHLALAVRELRRFTGGRGPVARRAEKRLTDQCKRIWRGQAVLSSTRRTISTSAEKGPDRRLCDAVSLTGRPCVRLLRENLARSASGRPGAFDLRACSSESVIRVACSCGRSVVECPDPFLPGLLNHTYPSQPCCAALADRTHDLAIGGGSTAASTRDPSGNGDKQAASTRPIRQGGSWMLHELGDSSAFDPADPVKFTGFVPRYDRLEPWKETGVYIGLEYESVGSGNRRFYPVSGLYSGPQGAAAAAAAASAVASAERDPDGLLQWPLQDIEVFIAPGNVAQDSFLQLQRIYVRVPRTASHRVLMHAHVHFRDFGNALFTHRPMELAPGRLYCLCLPHVYLDAHGCPITQASAANAGPHLASVARLRPGLLKAVATAEPSA